MRPVPETITEPLPAARMENWVRNFKLLKQAKESGGLNKPLREYLLQKLGVKEIIQRWEAETSSEAAIESFIKYQSGPNKTYVCQVCGNERPKIFSGATWNEDEGRNTLGLCNGNCMKQWYD